METTLDIAENGYEEAYRFLQNAYEENAENFGPQTLYFLACLAGGAGWLEKALVWLRKAITENGWWYRPEVLEDEDLELLKKLGNNHVDVTIGSALDLFGGKMKFEDVLAVCRR